LLWAAGQYHARALFWRGGHDGGQRVRTSVEHDSESSDGVGADASRVDSAIRPAVLALQDADTLERFLPVRSVRLQADLARSPAKAGHYGLERTENGSRWDRPDQ